MRQLHLYIYMYIKDIHLMLHGWEQLANKFDRGVYITTKGNFQRMPTIAEKSFCINNESNVR